MPPENPPPGAAPPIPDEDPTGPSALPLPLSASIVLTSLPRDAHSALSKATEEPTDGVPKKGKITYRGHESIRSLVK